MASTGGLAKQGDQHLGGQGLPEGHGGDQLFRHRQQQGPLQQRLKMQENRVVEQGQMPTLQAFNAPGRGFSSRRVGGDGGRCRGRHRHGGTAKEA